MKMKLRFPESEIGYWANRYTERQKEKDRIKEQQLPELKSNVQKRGYLTKKELHKIARWKSPRRADLTLKNPDDFIKDITKSAFTATDKWAKLLILTLLQGVRESQPLLQSYIFTMKGSTLSLIYMHFGLSVCRGKKEPHIRSGWSILSFVVKSRTGTTFQCENLIGHCGNFHLIMVKRNARGNVSIQP